MQLKSFILIFIGVVLLFLSGSSNSAQNNQNCKEYQVNVTNLSFMQGFTKGVLVIHSSDYNLFVGGQPASVPLQKLAEDGDLSGFNTSTSNTTVSPSPSFSTTASSSSSTSNSPIPSTSTSVSGSGVSGSSAPNPSTSTSVSGSGISSSSAPSPSPSGGTGSNSTTNTTTGVETFIFMNQTLPGNTTSTNIQMNGSQFHLLSGASRLNATNDGFMGFTDLDLNTISANNTFKTYTFAWDAGTEQNNELCTSFFGGPCTTRVPSQNFNESSRKNDTNFVFIHRGIHGIGNLNASIWDWRNPIALVTVQFVSFCNNTSRD